MVIEKIPQLGHGTWGSYGQHGTVTIMLPQGDRLLVLNVVKATPSTRGSSGEKTVTLGDYKIRLYGENRDSRKNLHRHAKVLSIEPIPPFVVVLEEYKSAKNFRQTFKVIDSQGVKVVTPVEEVVVEDKVTEKGVYKVEKVKRYIEYNGKRYLFEEYQTRVVESQLHTLEISIESLSGRICGDTYHIRDVIKNMGYKWDPGLKCWEPPQWWYLVHPEKEERKKKAEELKAQIELVAKKRGYNVKIEVT